tara:strand:- start:1044 stop:1502 length:459 start_codon:yes stop_codon:yes gene_type:complete
MAVQGSRWSKKANLGLAIETLASEDVPGTDSMNNTMGHFCYFEGLADTTKHHTRHFDFPVNGDLTIIVNPTGVNLDAALTVDVTMEGSVDNTTWVDLAIKTDLIQDSTGSIDEDAQSAVYDYDAHGRMPYMRLSIQGNTNCDSTYMVAVVPH